MAAEGTWNPSAPSSLRAPGTTCRVGRSYTADAPQTTRGVDHHRKKVLSLVNVYIYIICNYLYIYNVMNLWIYDTIYIYCIISHHIIHDIYIYSIIVIVAYIYILQHIILSKYWFPFIGQHVPERGRTKSRHLCDQRFQTGATNNLAVETFDKGVFECFGVNSDEILQS